VSPASRAWAEVDLPAIAHNVGLLRQVVAPAELLAVVKADGYGHGASPVAAAALDAGATALGVAIVDEGVALRDDGIEAPVLVLSEPRVDELDACVAFDLEPTVYTPGGIEGVAASAARLGRPCRVHVKVDTGMHRVGAAPHEALALVEAVDTDPFLELGSVFTHCAVADEPDDPFTGEQLRRFAAVLDELGVAGLHPPYVHAANSAGALCHPDARLDLVRCGIAVYGIAPAPGLAAAFPAVGELRPALSLKSTVSLVKEVAGGERISYGLRHRFDRDTIVATVPIGYADGVPRRLHALGAEVLVGGRRRPVVGVITMDQLMVDCGPVGADAPIPEVGDEVVLLGEQGGEQIPAEDWAGRLGTIAYEVVCGIGPRVPRLYRTTGVSAEGGA
jgi:alanine racemase